jgi:hypothetical protein
VSSRAALAVMMQTRVGMMLLLLSEWGAEVTRWMM